MIVSREWMKKQNTTNLWDPFFLEQRVILKYPSSIMKPD